jgi:alpha-glucan,water dikinase
MLESFEQRTILLVDRVNGEEEVPPNVQAIIYLNPNTGDHPDVLAHVSVRARNLKVMLAVVFEEKQCAYLSELEGKSLLLTPESNSSVKIEL